MSSFAISSTAQHYLKSSCNVIDISSRNLKPAPAPSNYTSHGKRKARPAEAIRTIEEVQAVKNYLLTSGKPGLRQRNYLMFVLGISVGLRSCDLLRLKVKDVVDCNGYVVDELSCYESKTKKMNHPIINDEAKKAIVDYLNSETYINADDYLFRAEGRDTPISVENLYMLMKKVEKELALPYHLGAHSMRKTFAYWTIRLHMNEPNVIYSLQEMLNHDSLKTTLHYSGQTHEDLRTLYNDMSGVLTGNVKTSAVTNKTEDKLDTILSLLLSDDDEGID